MGGKGFGVWTLEGLGMLVGAEWVQGEGSHDMTRPLGFEGRM